MDQDQDQDQDRDRPRGSAPDPVADRPTATIDADRAADAAPGQFQPGEDLKARQDRLLDEALQESFPGSDPISPCQIA